MVCESRIQFDRRVVIADREIVITFRSISIATIGIGDRQHQTRFLSGLDECRAALDLRLGSTAIRAVAQLDIF